jgi:hypothetical protein
VVSRDFLLANPLVRAAIAGREKGKPVSDDSLPLVRERPLRPKRGDKGETAEQVKLKKLEDKQRGPVRAATGAVRTSGEIREQLRNTSNAAERVELQRQLDDLKRDGKQGSPEYRRVNERLKVVRARSSNRPKKKLKRKPADPYGGGGYG